MFDFSIREVLNRTAPRRMAVLRPLKVVIENYPEGQTEELDAVNNPEDPAAGTRKIRFGREIYIERDDFMENPPKKFFRLVARPGGAAALRLFRHLPRGGEECGRRGGRAALHLRSGDARRQHAARRAQGAGDAALGVGGGRGAGRGAALQPAVHAGPIPDAGELRRRPQPELARGADRRACSSRRWPRDNASEPVQFERQGYFVRDPDCKPGRLVFNRTVGLRDTWAKVSGGGKG